MVIAIALSAALAGCVASDDAGDIPSKNRATWKMPLDEFYVYPPELDNYAEQLLIAECLRVRGYDWPVPWQDTDFTQPEDVNSIGLRIFTPDIASKWGYHFAPSADQDSAELWIDFVEITDAYFPNEELDKGLDDCTDEVRYEDPDPFSNFDGTNYLAGLSLQAEEEARRDETVIGATKEWRACLQPQVDYTVPADPWSGMPSRGAMKNWGLISDGTSEGTPEASAEEIAAAVADAECRESSGLSEAKYDRSWDVQLQLVEENRDELERIRDAAVERREKLLTIVAEHSPPAP